MKEIILTGYEARVKLMAGVDKAAKILNRTLGIGGERCLYESEYNQRVEVGDEMYDSQAPVSTSDGVRIMSKIKLKDPTEDLAAQALFEASKQQNTTSGDGTTTVVTLTHALVTSIMTKLNETGKADIQTINKHRLMQEIKADSLEVIEELKKKAKPIKTLQDLENIAMTAYPNEDLSKKIAGAWWKVGKDGDVSVVGWKKSETVIEVHDGMKVHAKLMSEYMRTNDKNEMRLSNALVLVTNHSIDKIEQIKGWLQLAGQRQRTELVIFAPKFSKEVQDTLNNLRITAEKFNKEEKKSKMVRVFGIKVPSLTEKEGGQLEDLAIFTGSTFIDSNKQMDMENVEFSYFGEAVSIFCNMEYAIIGGTNEEKVEVERKKRIKRLTTEMKEEQDPMFQEKLQSRIGSLSSGVATIKVGATTDMERRYDKLRLDDAKYACRNALQEGYIAGAGQVLRKVKCKNEYLKKALEAPHNVIMENIVEATEIPTTVIDPVKSEILAIERAVSTATEIIMSGITIAYDKETIEDKIDNLIEAIKSMKK